MDTKLTQEEVKHIALLANLTFKEEEMDKFQTQLSSVLDYIEKLQKLDVKNTRETNQVTGLENITSEDIPQTSFKQEEAISNANKQKNGTFTVKAIF